MAPDFKQSLRDDRVVNLEQHLFNADQFVAHLRQPCVEVQSFRVHADRNSRVGILVKILVNQLNVLLEPLANCVLALLISTPRSIV